MDRKGYASGEGLTGHREPETGNIDPSRIPELAVLASGYDVLKHTPKDAVPEGYVETWPEPDGEIMPVDICRLAGELVVAAKYCRIDIAGAMEWMARRQEAYNTSHEKAWGR